MHTFKPTSKVALPATLHFRIDRTDYEYEVTDFTEFDIGNGSNYDINVEKDSHETKIADRLRSNPEYKEVS